MFCLGLLHVVHSCIYIPLNVRLCSGLIKMNDTSDLDRQIEQLKRCEIIKESEVKALCAKAREILVEESNVQRVDSPVIVSVFDFIILF